MRKLFLVSIILFFVLAVIPTQRTKAAIDPAACGAATAIANVTLAIRESVCENGSAEACRDAIAESSRASARALVICNGLGNLN